MGDFGYSSESPFTVGSLLGFFGPTYVIGFILFYFFNFCLLFAQHADEHSHEQFSLLFAFLINHFSKIYIIFNLFNYFFLFTYI